LDNPSKDIQLVGPTASLITRNTTHPALLQLFTGAAHQIHGSAGWFAKTKQFPNAQRDELPMAQEAERYLKNGPPLLQRYLPFWLANLIDRMWVVLVSLLAVLIPLTRIVPPLYELRVCSRVFRWYRGLREIEEGIGTDKDSPTRQPAELDALDATVGRVTVPLSHADELYALRSHIDMVRRRLQLIVAGQRDPGPMLGGGEKAAA
jgi:hypothetical protein